MFRRTESGRWDRLGEGINVRSDGFWLTSIGGSPAIKSFEQVVGAERIIGTTIFTRRSILNREAIQVEPLHLQTMNDEQLHAAYNLGRWVPITMEKILLSEFLNEPSAAWRPVSVGFLTEQFEDSADRLAIQRAKDFTPERALELLSGLKDAYANSNNEVRLPRSSSVPAPSPTRVTNADLPQENVPFRMKYVIFITAGVLGVLIAIALCLFKRKH